MPHPSKDIPPDNIPPGAAIVDVAIIGSGFSGAAVAFHLAASCDRLQTNITCIIFDCSSELGRGIAYGTEIESHILNVPAGNMSITETDPSSFTRWLAENDHPHGGSPFAPRRLYGLYVSDVVSQAWRKIAPTSQLVQVPELVLRIAKAGMQGFQLTTANAKCYWTKNLVIAIGNSPGRFKPTQSTEISPNSETSRSPIYFLPGETRLYRLADQLRRVAVIGTGLSAIDAVLGLEQASFTGQYDLFSRRGLLPLPHIQCPHNPTEKIAAVTEGILAAATLRKKLRLFRQSCGANGLWRELIDALRPLSHRLWQELPLQEKRRFLRHLRPYWDIHRHRVPSASLDVLLQLKDMGRLFIHKGSVTSWQVIDESVIIDTRSLTEEERGPYDAIIDCRGLWSHLPSTADPLLSSLLSAGLATYDDLEMGLLTNPIGNLINTKGEPELGLYTLGSLRRGTLWESTAVREIRAQATKIAENVLQTIPVGTPSSQTR